MSVLQFKSEKKSEALLLENFDEGNHSSYCISVPDDKCGVEGEVPVILFLVSSFSGNKKYFCVKMLVKLLPDDPENIIRRAHFSSYGKKVNLYRATPIEVELLNRINTHHSHWTYSQQPFTGLTDLVSVSEFLPLLDYVRSYSKPQSVPRNTKANVSRPISSQAEEMTPTAADTMSNMISTPRRQSIGSFAAGSLPTRIYQSRDSTSNERLPIARPPITVMSVQRLSRPVEQRTHPIAPTKKMAPPPSTQQQPAPSRPAKSQPMVGSSNVSINPTNAGNEHVSSRTSNFIDEMLRQRKVMRQ